MHQDRRTFLQTSLLATLVASFGPSLLAAPTDAGPPQHGLLRPTHLASA